MFVVDLISASLLAVALTIGFTALVRGGRYRRLHELSAAMWLAAVAAWCGGMLIVAFGPTITGTHWLGFIASALCVAIAAVFLMRSRQSTHSVHNETGPPGADARPLVASFFIVTLLLFYCAISFRVFLVNVA